MDGNCPNPPSATKHPPRYDLLSDIMVRLAGSKGPDRSLDAEIHVALFGGPKAFAAHHATDKTRLSYSRGTWFTDADNFHVLTEATRKAPEYTADAGQALALLESIFEGWDFTFGRTNGGLTIHAQLGAIEEVFAETVPNAIVLAVLFAVALEQEPSSQQVLI